MALLTQSANPAVADGSPSRRKQKMKVQNETKISSIEWKSDSQHEIYSSKLLHALRQSRICGGGGAPRRVRETADRVLAATARGRTRWSRAILTNRLKLKKFMKKNSMAKRQRTVITAISPAQKKESKIQTVQLKSQMPAFQRKARFLGRLVPGCRKQPWPVVLEEATDYIAALQMQVRAMSGLANLLAVSGSSTATVPMPRHDRPGPNTGPTGGPNANYTLLLKIFYPHI